MLLCSENTASTVDSTQNKMILYHLSQNLCLQQRRKKERGRLQKEQVWSLQRYLDQSSKVSTASWHGICHSTSSSPGEMPQVHHRSLIPTIPGDAHQGTEQTPAAKGVLHPSLPTWEKQLAAARASGSSWGCQLLDPALCFWKRSCSRNYKTLLHLDEEKNFVAHGFALPN